mmetsp:Transcript_43661/g.50218  ORF Transcript_43661/g.50218 Transcript_43661/m.50218 type:complete len:496 (-) Transcript_43661:62-1549(-)
MEDANPQTPSKELTTRPTATTGSEMNIDPSTTTTTTPRLDINDITCNDRVREFLLQPGIMDQIHRVLSEKDIDPRFPCLRFEIRGENDAFELEKKDVLDFFGEYGKITDVIIFPRGIALVRFDHFVNAFVAQQSLNGLYVETIRATMLVKWYLLEQMNAEKGDHPLSLNQFKQESQDWNFYAELLAKFIEETRQSQSAVLDFDWNTYRSQVEEEQNDKVMKFSCKFPIQIENDIEFQVTRKVIGAKGCNMKKIIELALREAEGADMKNAHKFIKLRLRGKGSGHREGPGSIESDDPLHLCISSRHESVYHLACRLVGDLIHDIHEEYKRYLLRLGKAPPKNFRIKKFENFIVMRSDIRKVPPNSNTGTASNSRTSKGRDSLRTGGLTTAIISGGANARGLEDMVGRNHGGEERRSYRPHMSSDSLLEFFENKKVLEEDEVVYLVDARKNARRACNYSKADKVKEFLYKKGIILKDRSAEDTEWSYRTGFPEKQGN